MNGASDFLRSHPGLPSLSICILAPLFPPVIGGSETHTLTLALGLQERGHEVTVITDQTVSKKPNNGSLDRLHIIRTHTYLQNIEELGKVPWEECVFGLLREIMICLDGRHYDLIHAQNQVSTLLGAMIKQSTGLPLVCTMHEQSPERDAYGVGRSNIILGYLPYDLLLAGSNYYCAQALSFGAPPEKVRLVYYGTDLNRFRPGLSGERIREYLRIDSDTPLIILSGRFTPRKGQIEFVQAMATVHQFIPRAVGCLIGSVNSAPSEYIKTIRDEIERLHLHETVLLIDDIFHWEDMPEVYSAANVVVLPSYAEGFGLAIIEAMACGKPVIGTDVDGISEIISSSVNGMLVPSKDPQKLADEIIHLLIDTDFASVLAKRGLTDVRNRFGSDRMVDEVEKAYYSLVAPATVSEN